MEITRHFRIDAGHRVYGHESKCAHLHGHSYSIDVTVTAPSLDTLGRVIDFSAIKTLVGTWLDEHWDHNFLAHPEDTIVTVLSLEMHGRQPYLMRYGNPTAENIAKELFEIASSLLSSQSIVVTRVRVYETPNCWADYDGAE